MRQRPGSTGQFDQVLCAVSRPPTDTPPTRSAAPKSSRSGCAVRLVRWTASVIGGYPGLLGVDGGGSGARSGNAAHTSASRARIAVAAVGDESRTEGVEGGPRRVWFDGLTESWGGGGLLADPLVRSEAHGGQRWYVTTGSVGVEDERPKLVKVGVRLGHGLFEVHGGQRGYHYGSSVSPASSTARRAAKQATSRCSSGGAAPSRLINPGACCSSGSVRGGWRRWSAS